MRIGDSCLVKVVAFLKHHEQEALHTIPPPLGAMTLGEVSPGVDATSVI